MVDVWRSTERARRDDRVARLLSRSAADEMGIEATPTARPSGQIVKSPDDSTHKKA